MRAFIAIGLFLALLCGRPALAQNWAGNTAADYHETQDACYHDAYRFCGGNTIFGFVMETCLQRHLPRLSKACRAELAPTDFRKYHRAEPFDLDLPF